MGFIILVKVKLKEKNVLPPDLDKEALQTLSKELRLETENLYLEKDNERKCESMEKIVQLIIQDDEIYPDMIAALGSCISCLLKNQIEEKILPAELNDEWVSFVYQVNQTFNTLIIWRSNCSHM